MKPSSKLDKLLLHIVCIFFFFILQINVVSVYAVTTITRTYTFINNSTETIWIGIREEPGNNDGSGNPGIRYKKTDGSTQSCSTSDDQCASLTSYTYTHCKSDSVCYWDPPILSGKTLKTMTPDDYELSANTQKSFILRYVIENVDLSAFPRLRITARTGCVKDSNNLLLCKTAHCASDTTTYSNANCFKSDGSYEPLNPPYTNVLIYVSTLGVNSGQDTYGTYIKTGYNMGMKIAPTDSGCPNIGGDGTWDFSEIQDLTDLAYYTYVTNSTGVCPNTAHICGNEPAICGQFIASGQRLYCDTPGGYFNCADATAKWGSNPPFACTPPSGPCEDIGISGIDDLLAGVCQNTFWSELVMCDGFTCRSDDNGYPSTSYTITFLSNSDAFPSKPPKTTRTMTVTNNSSNDTIWVGFKGNQYKDSNDQTITCNSDADCYVENTHCETSDGSCYWNPLTKNGSAISAMTTDDYKLLPGMSNDFTISYYDTTATTVWDGTIVARTGCTPNPSNNKQMTCTTANCVTGSGTYGNASCAKEDNTGYADFNTPVTKVKMTLLANEGGSDTYSVSMETGYNIAVTAQPTPGQTFTTSGQTCTIAGDTSSTPTSGLGQCTWNLSALCNSDYAYYMKVTNAASEECATTSSLCSTNTQKCGQAVNSSEKLYCGEPLGYLIPSDACTKWGTPDEYPFSCTNTTIYNTFKNACPSAIVDAATQGNSFTCNINTTSGGATYNNASYTVTFFTPSQVIGCNNINTQETSNNNTDNGMLVAGGLGGLASLMFLGALAAL